MKAKYAALRPLFISLFLTLIIFATAAGLTVVAFQAQSALTPAESPASAYFSEDGTQYIISIFDRNMAVPVFSGEKIERLFNRFPTLLPQSIIILSYVGNKLSEFLKPYV
ncbi:MAG: hypothetical protein RR977_04640 [Oscillospiraceae bacterium]